MKYKIYILIVLMWIGGSSCEDWLDVDSDSRVVQEDLLSSSTGFRTALNGVYRLLGSSSLYAKELNWGLTSVLAQNYTGSNSGLGYRFIVNGDYEIAESINVIDPVFQQGYRVIANCNNLLKHAEDKDPNFFLRGEEEKNLIVGELLGVRALVHFDLLRLFAPAPILDDEKPYIPYVTDYPVSQPKHLTVDVVLDSVIHDLKKAQSLLAYFDTITASAMNSSAGGRMIGGWSNKEELFFSARGTRMNYFVATGLLARVYLYKGDKANALLYAKEVYRYATEKTWFKFSSGTIDPKLYDDMLFATVNNHLYDLFEAAFSGSWKLLFYSTIKNLFGDDVGEDYRYTKLIGSDRRSLRWVDPKESEGGSTVANMSTSGPLAPVMRMSEIYHIMCECLVDSDLEQAITILDDLRRARGVTTRLSSELDKEAFLELLYNDIIRESLSEGQSFFMHKRLDKIIYQGTTAIDMSERWVLPIPYGETAYSTL